MCVPCGDENSIGYFRKHVRLHPRVGFWEGLPAAVHTSAISGISTVYLRNMKHTKLNNELSTKFQLLPFKNIRILTPKSIFLLNVVFVKLTVQI